MITDKEDQMFSCIYGCPMDHIKTIEELQGHYLNIHSDLEVPWAIYDHTFLRHLPYLFEHESRHKE